MSGQSRTYGAYTSGKCIFLRPWSSFRRPWEALIHLVGHILLAFLLAPSLFLLVDKLAKLLVKLQLTLLCVELCRHGKNLLVVGRFGTPLALHLQVGLLAHRTGHEVFVGDSGESPIKVIFMLLLDVLFEVVAWDNGIGVEEDANGVVNGGTMGNDLSVVFIELAMNFIDNAAHSCCKYS